MLKIIAGRDIRRFPEQNHICDFCRDITEECGGRDFPNARPGGCMSFCDNGDYAVVDNDQIIVGKVIFFANETPKPVSKPVSSRVVRKRILKFDENGNPCDGNQCASCGDGSPCSESPIL